MDQDTENEQKLTCMKKKVYICAPLGGQVNENIQNVHIDDFIDDEQRPFEIDRRQCGRENQCPHFVDQIPFHFIGADNELSLIHISIIRVYSEARTPELAEETAAGVMAVIAEMTRK